MNIFIQILKFCLLMIVSIIEAIVDTALYGIRNIKAFLKK